MIFAPADSLPRRLRLPAVLTSRSLLLAAALAVLAGVLVYDAESASARHDPDHLIEATLTVGEVGQPHWNNHGCSGSGSSACSSLLSRSTFTLEGRRYRVDILTNYYLDGRGRIQLRLFTADGSPVSVSDEAAAGDLTLRIGNREFKVSERSSGAVCGGDADCVISWDDVGTTILEEGQTVSVRLEYPWQPQRFPTMNRLRIDTSIDPFPPGQRVPEFSGASSADGYCYLGEGRTWTVTEEGTPKTYGTEYIRWANGRIQEVTRQTQVIRSMFACH